MSRGLTAAYAAYPYLGYGTDWLAFGHLSIAVAFWGPYREPVRNVWVLKFAAGSRRSPPGRSWPLRQPPEMHPRLVRSSDARLAA